jgi:hypothetical protein
VGPGPPARQGTGLRDEHALFVRLGRHGREQPESLSPEAIYRLVNRHCLAAGIPDRLAHPHALRSYWATHLLEAGASIHEVSARLGTSTYAPPPVTPRCPSTARTISRTRLIAVISAAGGAGSNPNPGGAMEMIVRSGANLLVERSGISDLRSLLARTVARPRVKRLSRTHRSSTESEDETSCGG